MIACTLPGKAHLSYQGGVVLASWGQLRPATDRERQAETEVPPDYRNKKTFETRGKRKVDDISEQALPEESNQGPENQQNNADNPPETKEKKPIDQEATGATEKEAQPLEPALARESPAYAPIRRFSVKRRPGPLDSRPKPAITNATDPIEVPVPDTPEKNDATEERGEVTDKRAATEELRENEEPDATRMRILSPQKAIDQEAPAQENCGYVCDDDDVHPAFLSEKQAAKRKEVYPWKMNDHDRNQFYAAKKKEWLNIVAANAVTILEAAEAADIRLKHPDRILASRHCYTWKPTEEGETAKCRWVALGHQHPGLAKLMTYAPMVTKESWMMAVQFLASFGFDLELGDISSAFMNGLPYLYDGEHLYCELPPDGIPGVAPGSLIQLDVAVYGLPEAPQQWHRSFNDAALKAGFKQSSFDPCLYTITSKKTGQNESKIHGVLALAVDDTCGGGDATWKEAMDKLKKRFPFGKWRCGSGTFCGRSCIQDSDKSVRVHQKEFAEKIPLIPLSTERRRHPKEPCTEEEITLLRGAAGSCLFLARETRPDLAGPVSLLQGSFPRPTVADMKEANRIVRMAHDFSDTKVTIQSIPPKDLTFLTVTDAAWGNAKGHGSQAGWILLAAHQDVLKGKWGKISPLAWKSHKLARKVQSSLAAETMGIDEGIANGIYHRAVWTQMLDSSLDARQACEKAPHQFKLTVVTDCKCAYDHLSNTTVGPSKDKRTALDIAIIREAMQSHMLEIRWIDGKRQQITDPLTKRAGNADLLRGVMMRGEYVLIEEKRALDIKDQERQARHLLRGMSAEAAFSILGS